MAIYDLQGNSQNSAYSLTEELNVAYDIDGNIIFRKQSPATIKVMSYNVGQWYYGSGDNVPADKDSAYYALQNAMIQNADADVVFLVEYWKLFSKTGRTALSLLEQYYTYIHEQGGESGYFGRCICSKYPITNYTVHTYSGTSRYYDSCNITINGTVITLVVTHLDTSNARFTQITELINYLSTLNSFVCAGDFNTLTITGTVTTDATDYTNIIVPLLNAGFHCANCSNHGFLVTYSDEPTGTYVGCLDNIVTSENIQIISASVDTTKLTDGLTERTDHMPLIATLTIGGN